MAASLTLTTLMLAPFFLGGDSVKDTTGYIDGKTGEMAATNMDGHAYYELVCPAATGAFAGLNDIAASDSGKVEITHRRPSYAGASAHDRRKMKKAAPAPLERPRSARPLETRNRTVALLPVQLRHKRR